MNQPDRDPENLTPDAARQLLRELRERQAELERRNEELLRTQLELETARRRLVEARRELVAAREAERRRVSSVVHHDVGSLAVGMSAQLDAVAEELRRGRISRALELLEAARKLFDETVAGLKALAFEFQPPELSVLGLCATLQEHFARLSAQTGIEIDFRCSLGRRRLPNETATVLFRIVQEALTNAIRHGHARRAQIKLSVSRGQVRLSVRDNGAGFCLAAPESLPGTHLGLRVMQELASSVEGTWAVESKPGCGTTLTANVPLVGLAQRTSPNDPPT